MPQRVSLGTIEFPDEMSPEMMSAHIRNHLSGGLRPGVPFPQPMTSAQMGATVVPPAQPLQTVNQSLQNAIPPDAGLRPQTTMDQLRQYRDTMGRLIAPAVGMNFDEMSADAAKGILRQVIAFHGSPHTFDTFDASKIGSGEGAQAYGHGLYFAENPEVAGQYKKALSGKTATGLDYDSYKISQPQAQQLAQRWLTVKDTNPGGMEAFRVPADSPYGEDKLLNDVIDGKIKWHTGNLYNVNIPDEHTSKMLDWDKPLSEQAPEVQKALKDAGIGGEAGMLLDRGHFGTGAQLYQTLSSDAAHAPLLPHQVPGDPFKRANASEFLNSLGIPGIKYLDQGSRTAGQGTRNFVVFDPKILQDVKRQ